LAKFRVAKKLPSRGMIIMDPPGLGKTMMALMAILDNKDVPGCFSLMVTTPQALNQTYNAIVRMLQPVSCTPIAFQTQLPF